MGFLSWVETDLAGKLTVTDPQVLFTNLSLGDSSFVSLAGTYTDLTFDGSFLISSGQNNAYVNLLAYGDTFGSLDAQTNHISFRANTSAVGVPSIRLYTNAVTGETVDFTISFDTRYYFTFTRSGTTVTVVTYTDFARLNPINTQVLNDTARSYPYQFVTQSFDNAQTATISGDVSQGEIIVDPVIVLTPQVRPIQRDLISGNGTITISGTYADPLGELTTLEYKFWTGAWIVFDSTPTGGTFSEVVTDVPPGRGLEVRFANEITVTDTDADATIGDGYIVGGQSNASGETTTQNVYSSTDGFKAFMWNRDGTEWLELADPSDPDRPLKGSVWPLVATLLMDSLHVPVFFITAAIGGTELSTPPFLWKKPNAAYNGAMSEFNSSGVNGLRAILFYQGEDDTLGESTQAAWETAASDMLDDFQTDMSLPLLKMVVAQIGQVQVDAIPVADVFINNVRLANRGVVDTDSDMLAGPLPYFLNLKDAGGDGVHITTDAEANLLAAHWDYFIRLGLFSGAGGREPRFLSANIAGVDEILVSFTVANSPLQDASTSGWRVEDDTGILTVTNAVIQDSTKVLLTVNRALDVNPIVSYGYGNEAAVDANFRDSATVKNLNPLETGLPPEPFIEEATTVNPIPVVTITSPTSNPTYATPLSTIDLAGTSSISSGTVDSVSWSNDRGGSGVCTGTTTWGKTGITLLSGVNILTVTATSDLGETNTDVLTVTYTPINPIPVIEITSPTSSPTYATALNSINIAGNSSVSSGSITSVTWVNDRGGSGTCSGTTSWSQAGITLLEGINVLTVTATTDLSEINTDILTVTYTAVNPIPNIDITSPTSNPTYSTTTTPINIGGTSSISSGSVASVTWVNNRGGSGTATGTTTWSVTGIVLLEGTNVLTVTATSGLGEIKTDNLTITKSGVQPVPDSGYSTGTTAIKIASNALLLIGDNPISSFSDPGAGAQIAANIYYETYKSMLAEHPWAFAMKELSLSRLSQVPDSRTNYSYAFQLPSDLIRVWAIMDHSNYTIVGSLVYSNSKSLLCRYIAQVDETELPPHFVTAMQYKLASDFAISVTEDVSKSQLYEAKYLKQISLARSVDSQNKPQVSIIDSPFIDVRMSGVTSGGGFF